MDEQDKIEDIVNRLKQYSAAGLKYEQAKENLIAQGCSEEEINKAADSYQYGEKVNSDIPQKTTNYFKNHPDKAAIDGANLLKAYTKEQIADDRNKAIADAMAAQAAGELGIQGTDAQVEYESKFANDVGISFWLLITLGLIINAAAYFIVWWLKINYPWVYVINGILTVALVIYLIKRIR